MAIIRMTAWRQSLKRTASHAPTHTPAFALRDAAGCNKKAGHPVFVTGWPTAKSLTRDREPGSRKAGNKRGYGVGGTGGTPLATSTFESAATGGGGYFLTGSRASDGHCCARVPARPSGRYSRWAGTTDKAGGSMKSRSDGPRRPGRRNDCKGPSECSGALSFHAHPPVTSFQGRRNSA